MVTHWGGSTAAFYAPGGYLVFRDGNSSTFSTAEDLDSVTHEYGHGIVDAETGVGLPTGVVDGADAWAEGYGDWAATVPDVLLHGGVATLSTWQIGALDRSNPLDGIRNLLAPKSEDLLAVDWFPSRTLDRAITSRYRNSSVMGHALYLLAANGPVQHYRAGIPVVGVPVIPVTGVGYATARNIFYNALFQPSMGPSANYFTLRSAMVQSAPLHQTSIEDAWAAVGLGNNCAA